MQRFKRALRVFLLDRQVFEDVGTDQRATVDALIIVTVVAIIGAIAAAITAAFVTLGFGLLNVGLGAGELIIGEISFRLPMLNPIGSFFRHIATTYVSWLLWALVTFVVGQYVFKGDTNFREMLRILGFAMVPRVLSGLGFIPGVNWIPGLIGWIWALAAGFVGIRQGLELSTGKTILVIVLSVVIILLTNHFVIDPIFDIIF